MPNVVLFDFGDTVIHEVAFDRRAGYTRIHEIAENADEVVLDDWLSAAEEIDRRVLPHRDAHQIEVSNGRLLRLLCDVTGLRVALPPVELEWEFWSATARVEPSPGIGKALDCLAERGIVAGMVSNSTSCSEVLRRALARYGFDRHFRLVIASSDYGIRKPNPMLFRAACGRLRLRPVETLFVGDSLVHDIAGARAVGMRAVWYNPGGAAPPADPPPQIRHWRELEGHVSAA